MLFVQHEFALEVLDCHVIDCSSQKGELAVRYRAGPVPGNLLKGSEAHGCIRSTDMEPRLIQRTC